MVTRIKDFQKNRNNMYKYLLVVLVFLSIVLLLIFQFFNIKSIEIVGNEYYSDEQIKSITGINNKTNVLLYRLGQKNNNTSNYPYIENINISFLSYNRVLIEVMEKIIIAYIPYMGKYLCIDKNGVVIDYVSDTSEGIPIVRGLAFEYFIIGDKLNLNNSMFQAILEIYQNMHKYKIKVNIINFSIYDEKNIELYVGDLRILLGDITNSNEKFQTIRAILKEIDGNDNFTLDLRKDGNRFILK